MFSGIWLGYKICAGHHLKENVCDTDLHHHRRNSKNYTKSYNQMKNEFYSPKRVKTTLLLALPSSSPP
jgi:hypothetical protein